MYRKDGDGRYDGYGRYVGGYRDGGGVDDLVNHDDHIYFPLCFLYIFQRCFALVKRITLKRF